MQVRRAIAETLESGKFQGIVARLAAQAWARAAVHGLARPLVWPNGKRVVAIGGATLGGSGKTPLAMACAEHLARANVRVCIVGHAYGASPGVPRVVAPDDPLGLVGDEAAMCAAALWPWAPLAEVIVAPTRQAALDLAFARGADVAILDGVLQTAPCRATLALLAVDGTHPWGAGACPPAGDLRAPPGALVAISDQMVRIGTGAGMDAVAFARGAWLADRLIPWSELRACRVGLLSALARPARVLAVLGDHGIRPVHVIALPDHAAREKSRLAPPEQVTVDVWLATAKCRTGLPATLGDAPLATLEYALRLSSAVKTPLDAAAHNASHAFATAPARTG